MAGCPSRGGALFLCDQLRVPVRGGETSVLDARYVVDAWCDRWAIGTDAREELRLLASELATNALVHGWPPIELTLSLTGSWAEVSVRDASPCGPVVRPPRHDLLADLDVVAVRTDGLPDDPRDPVLRVGPSGSVTAGRGMLIVAAVAADWGITALAVGKEVWVRLRVAGTGGSRVCPCRAGDTTTPGGLVLRLLEPGPPAG